MRFDPDEELIGVGCSDGYVKLYNLQQNKL